MFAVSYILCIVINSLWTINTVRCAMYIPEKTSDSEVFKVIGDIVLSNYNANGWSAILSYGAVPDEFYSRVRGLPLTHLRMDAAYAPPPAEAYDLPYQLHTVVISCENLSDYSDALQKVTKLPHWNPHANIILTFNNIKDELTVAKVFYMLWWHQSISAVIVHRDGTSDTIEIYNYTPYTHDGYRLRTAAACWATKRWNPYYIGNVATFAHCELGCENLTTLETRPRYYLLTCLSFDKRSVSVDSPRSRATIKLTDQTRNMHGYPLKAYGSQIPPFLLVEFFGNGSYELQRRDGLVWRAVAERMNFTIRLVNLEAFDKPFAYASTIKMVMDMSYRLLDFVLFPIYQLDMIVTKTDLCAPLRASGVCIVAHRAGFESSWLDATDIEYSAMAEFTACLVAVWGTLALFKYFELRRLSLDQLGKDFSNTVRTLLSVTLHRPPRQQSFRVYLAVSLWCFFILNFILQASIVSFMTVLKRGKEVETFADVVQRGYPVKGFWSPDMFLPEEEEVYIQFNKLKVQMEDIFECVNELEHNPRVFCLLDCANALYLQKNKLNMKGEQYIHVLKDRVHSLFLNMMLPHKSPLKRTMDRYFMALVEGGFLKKFEGYRYEKFQDTGFEVKSISMNDLSGIFRLQLIASFGTVAVFLCEVTMGVSRSTGKYLRDKIGCLWGWVKRNLRRRKVASVGADVSTQTFP